MAQAAATKTSFNRLCCHFLTAVSASSAGINAFLHPADSFTGSSAFEANLRTFLAGVFMVERTNNHEICARSAHPRTGQKQNEMFVRIHGVSSIRGGGAQAGRVAVNTSRNAIVHFLTHLVHGELLSIVGAELIYDLRRTKNCKIVSFSRCLDFYFKLRLGA